MNQLSKIILTLSTALLFIIAPLSHSTSISQSMEEQRMEEARLEDEVGQVREANKDAQDAFEDAGKNRAGRVEERADQLRDSAEGKADRMKD